MIQWQRQISVWDKMSLTLDRKLQPIVQWGEVNIYFFKHDMIKKTRLGLVQKRSGRLTHGTVPSNEQSFTPEAAMQNDFR